MQISASASFPGNGPARVAAGALHSRQPTYPRQSRYRRGAVAGLIACVLTLSAAPAQAIPQFARTYGVSCNACHSVVPMLNERGLAFEARGYRGSPEFEQRKRDFPQYLEALPLSLWMTGRHEWQDSADFEDTYLPKVELISGGPIGDNLSYFVEWRVVSLETRSDGSRRDRSGRFEDAYFAWDIDDRFSLQIGQYRALNQVDVSRRLSISEPTIFSTSLPGKPTSDARIRSLRGFSPAGRSPGVTLGYQSIIGDSPADGLFHFVTLPLVGELSLPLTREARQEASFELQGPPKGVYLETFYRRGFNSIGAHAFIDDDRRLLTGVGTLAFGDLHLTAGLGVDDRAGAPARWRSSFQGEYLWIRDARDALRPAVGFRVEHVSRSDREPAFIPYLAVAGPNRLYNFLLQLQYRAQSGHDALIVDLSVFF